MSDNCPSRPRRRFLFWRESQPHEFKIRQIYKFMPGVSQHFNVVERCVHCALDRKRHFVESQELLEMGYSSNQLMRFSTARWQTAEWPKPAGNPFPPGRPLPCTPTQDLPLPATEASIQEALDLLMKLVELRQHKYRHGKDAHYLEHQPATWQAAYDHLKKHGYDVSQLPPP